MTRHETNKFMSKSALFPFQCIKKNNLTLKLVSLAKLRPTVQHY